MSIKVFSEDSRFIAGSNKDLFAISISDDTKSVNYFLDDEEVRELQALCEYHLNKANNND